MSVTMTYRVPTVFYRFDYVVHPFAVSWRQAYQAFQFRVAELESSVLDLIAVSLSSGLLEGLTLTSKSYLQSRCWVTI